MKHRSDEDFEDFIEYNDIGLPLAHFINSNLVKSTPEAEKFINETFDLLLSGLGVEDTGFDDLEELLSE